MVKKFKFLFVIFLISLNTGCSFIKDKFFKPQQKEYQEQNQGTEQQEEQPKKKSDPIPTNPQHS